MPKDSTLRQRDQKSNSPVGGVFETRPREEAGKWKVASQSGFANTLGIQVTESEGHPWPQKRGRFKGDVGGPFGTYKTKLEVVTPRSITLRRDTSSLTGPTIYNNRYKGSVCAPFPTSSGKPQFPSASFAPSSDVNEMGAIAIARCSPTNSVANASTFLAELHREKLPHLPGCRTLESRLRPLLNVADEFLNVEFGWLPIISDVTDLANAVKKASTVLKQYKRDEGKLVRRMFRFPIERSESEESLGESYPFLNGNLTGFNSLGPKGVNMRRRVSTRELWFSGAFTYHIPDQNDSWKGLMDAESTANKLLGTTLTPASLWELTPWSWAVDWFSNAQEVITNLQNIEIYGLVLQYGYMMEHRSNSDIYTMKDRTGLWYDTKGSLATSVEVPLSSCSSVILSSESKTRVKANPFGFGLTEADLSPTQIAIAAALGITLLL